MPNRYKKIIIPIMSILAFLILANITSAADTVSFSPEVGLGDSFKAGANYTINGKTIGKAFISIYKYGIGLMGLLATVIMMLGGLKWMTSAGDSKKIGEAKNMITASLTGIAVGLCAYIILAAVNTNLTKTYDISLTKIIEKPIDHPYTTVNTVEDPSRGCCIYQRNGAQDSFSGTKEQCDQYNGNFILGRTAYGTGSCGDETTLCIDRSDGVGIIKNGAYGVCVNQLWQRCKGAGEECSGVGKDYECCGGVQKRCLRTSEAGRSTLVNKCF